MKISDIMFNRTHKFYHMKPRFHISLYPTEIDEIEADWVIISCFKKTYNHYKNDTRIQID